eukprot:gene10471-14070_t
MIPTNDEDAHALLKIAREYRSTPPITSESLIKAIQFYEHILDFHKPIPKENQKDSKYEDEIFYALVEFELSQLLTEHSSVASHSKYKSFSLLTSSADSGNQYAQHKLSTVYATGIYNEGLVPMDAARALSLEYISALSGNPLANVGMGYRYLHGIGVTESCERALPFYEYAANFAASYIEHLGYQTFPDKLKLSEADDPNARWLKAEATQEVTDYYSHLAEMGDSMAAFTIGNLFATGSRLIPVDMSKAMYYLNLAAEARNHAASGQLSYLLMKRYIRRKNRPNQDTVLPEDVTVLPARIADNTTHMLELSKFSIRKGDLHGILASGYSYYQGIENEVNITKAVEQFQKLLGAHMDAGYYLGQIYMGENGHEIDIASAVQAYTFSSQLGNALAQHRLAHLMNKGIGLARVCSTVAQNFKSVAERAKWSLVLREAHKHYYEGNKQLALFQFAQLSAIGFESAQFNAAYILSKANCPSMISLTEPHKNIENAASYIPINKWQSSSADPTVSHDNNNQSDNQTVSIGLSDVLDAITSQPVKESVATLHRLIEQTKQTKKSINDIDCETRSLMLFGLSASQGNSESYLKLGDFYYYELAKLEKNRAEAALYYQKAADLKHTQAVFNLGMMYESGDGVRQDFHLAKRYYDMAAEIDGKAKVARDIALYILQSHKYFTAYYDYIISLAHARGYESQLSYAMTVSSDVTLLVLNIIELVEAKLRATIDGLMKYSHKRVADVTS